MPPPDPYKTLELACDATPEQVRSAYRKLAKTHHPDLNPGNAAAEERFKAVNAVHELLSDPDKRARFDRGEIDAAGDPAAPEPPRYRRYADAAEGGATAPSRRTAIRSATSSASSSIAAASLCGCAAPTRSTRSRSISWMPSGARPAR